MLNARRLKAFYTRRCAKLEGMESSYAPGELSLQQVMERLGIDEDELHVLVKNHHLASLRNPAGELFIPEDFLMQTENGKWVVVETLRATLILLLDSGFDVDEAAQWMLRPNDQLDGDSPIAKLRANNVHRVRAVAAACAF